MTDFMDKLNEPQRETLDQLRLALHGSRHTDVRVRKDGEYHWFEADWLRDALDLLCGPHPEIERRILAIMQTAPAELRTGATGPETAAP